MRKTLKIAANLLAATVVVGNMAACGVPSSFNASDFVKSDGENLSKAKSNLKGITFKIEYSKELIEDWNRRQGFQALASNPNFYRMKIGARHISSGFKPADQFSTPSVLSERKTFEELPAGDYSVFLEADDKNGNPIISTTKVFTVVVGQETQALMSLVLPGVNGKMTVTASVS